MVRPRRKSLFSVVAIAAALVVFPSISGADSTAPPVVTTGAATNVTDVAAQLNGTITTNDDAGATYSFEWGQTNTYGNTTAPKQTSAADTTEAASDQLASLTPGTTYHYKLCATNGPPVSGSDCGGDQSLRTPDQPDITTSAPTAVHKNSATLHGTVNPNGDDTHWVFKYGTTSGNLTSSSTGGDLSGTTAQGANDGIAGLSPNTTYFFQLCASNTYGAPCSSAGSFTTPDAPSATTTAATSVGQTSATINGSVDPNGASTTTTFSWGTTSGNLTSSGAGTPSPLTGTNAQSVSRSVTGLTAGRTYFFKVCASNAETTSPVCGSELSFFTASAPTVTTDAANGITTSGATLNGTVNPNNDATSYTYSWGTSSGNYTTGSVTDNLAAGTSAVSVPKTVSLSPHTTYFFRLCATNGTGTTCGNERSFFVPDVPSVTTNLSATNIAKSTASISGSVNPNGGASTTYTFQWGTSSGNYNVGSAGGSLTTGTTSQNVATGITGLAGNTVYFFRLCASNAFGGPICGAEGQFQTLDAPSTIAGAATNVATSTATLTGTVTPTGSNVSSTFFKYGKTCSAGDGWVSGCVQAGASPNTSSGRSSVNVSANLTGLQTGTVFHYTVCATNSFGTSCDLSDHTFRTNAPPTALLKENKASPGPLQVSFDGSASTDSDGSIASWSLSFGDGTAPTTGTGIPGNAIVHTYANPGPYTAVLTVTDDQGISAQSAALNVVVPSISVADAPAVTEGGVAAFVVTLSAVSNHDVTVAYSTASGTATDGVDYTNAQGVLLIPAGTCGPGTSACQIAVQTTQEGAFEANETFTLNLASPTGTSILRAAATGTINNDDQPPALVIRNASRLEGDDGTAVSGAQSWPAGGNVTVASGARFNRNEPFYIGDARYTFTGTNGNVLTGVKPNGSAVDGAPAYQTSWLNQMVFEVDLCDPTKTSIQDPCPEPITAGAPVTVNFATRNGSTDTTNSPVKAYYDYVPACSQAAPPINNNPLKLQCPDTPNQQLVIPAGASSGMITEPNTALVIGNDTPQIGVKNGVPTQEFTRWFFMRITSATNVGVIRDTEATGLIIDDDAPNPPTVTSDQVTDTSDTTASISTVVNPRGKETSVFIEFGKTDKYGSKLAAEALPAVAADQGTLFSLPNLAPDTVYHYHVVATHDIGAAPDYATGYGSDHTFKTKQRITVVPPPLPPPGQPPPPPPPPGAHTDAATKISIHGATLAGTVVPNGAETTAWVEIGKTTAYGMRTAVK